MSYQKTIVKAEYDHLVITMIKGQDYTINLRQQDAAEAVVDFSAYTASLKIFDADDVELEELTTANSRITLAATDPNIVLTWTDTDLNNYTNDAVYKGDLLLIDGSGDKPAEYAYRIHVRVSRGYL